MLSSGLRTKEITALVFILLGSCQVAFSGEVSLRYALAKDSRTSYEYQLRQTIHNTVLELDVSFNVQVKDKQDDGTAMMTLSVERAKLLFFHQGRSSTFDTQSPEARVTNPLFNYWRAISQTAISYLVEPNGTCRLLTDIETLAKESKGDYGNNEDRRRFLEHTMRNEVRRMLPEAICRLPERPVAVGTGWKTARDLVLPLANLVYRSSYDCKVVKMDATRLRIDMRLVDSKELNPKPHGYFSDSRHAKITKSKGEGHVVFNTRTGRIDEFRLEETLRFKRFLPHATVLHPTDLTVRSTRRLRLSREDH